MLRFFVFGRPHVFLLHIFHPHRHSTIEAMYFTTSFGTTGVSGQLYLIFSLSFFIPKIPAKPKQQICNPSHNHQSCNTFQAFGKQQTLTEQASKE